MEKTFQVCLNSVGEYVFLSEELYEFDERLDFTTFGLIPVSELIAHSFFIAEEHGLELALHLLRHIIRTLDLYSVVRNQRIVEIELAEAVIFYFSSR